MSNQNIEDGNHLAVLGYEQSFDRSMSLWANFALGFTYLSPLVGVYSLFAIAMATGGPPSIFWIFIVAGGQFLVSLVFGEVVSQYPIHGGIYPWTRRLWGKRYAWMAAWIYIWAMIVTITAVAQFGSGFVASTFGVELTRGCEAGHGRERSRWLHGDVGAVARLLRETRHHEAFGPLVFG